MNLPTITIVRGTDFTIPIEFQTPQGGALDITGCVIYFTVKKRWDNDSLDSTAAFKKDTTIHTDPTAGKTAISGVPDDTRNASPDTYEYDIEMRDAASRIISFGKGAFIIQGEITRRV